MNVEVVKLIIELLANNKAGILIFTVFPFLSLAAITYSMLLIKKSLDKNSEIISNNTKMIRALISLYLEDEGGELSQLDKISLLDIREIKRN